MNSIDLSGNDPVTDQVAVAVVDPGGRFMAALHRVAGYASVPLALRHCQTPAEAVAAFALAGSERMLTLQIRGPEGIGPRVRGATDDPWPLERPVSVIEVAAVRGGWQFGSSGDGGPAAAAAGPWVEDTVIGVLDGLEWALDRVPPSVSASMLSLHEALQARRQRPSALESALAFSLRRLAAVHDAPRPGHTVRVGLFAECIGRASGLTEDQAARLRVAAELHDIGFASLDAGLRGGLRRSPAQREAYRLHPQHGAQLLQPYGTALFRLAAEVARSHHERWDGWGFPDALSGEDIPLSGRIVAIAHRLDMVATCSAPQPSEALDAAFERLRAEANQAFDPVLVAAAVQAQPELERLYQLAREGAGAWDLLAGTPDPDSEAVRPVALGALPPEPFGHPPGLDLFDSTRTDAPF